MAFGYQAVKLSCHPYRPAARRVSRPLICAGRSGNELAQLLCVFLSMASGDFATGAQPLGDAAQCFEVVVS